MAIEIERKFLVFGDSWREDAITQRRIKQAYLSSSGRSSTRVRISGDSNATLTVKSRPAELRRIEVEYPIRIADAEALLALRDSNLIDKIRHEVPCGPHVWEVDEFLGDNAGLVIAEIELSDEAEKFGMPAWLGLEVTGLQQYYNGSLAQSPYCRWATNAAAI